MHSATLREKNNIEKYFATKCTKITIKRLMNNSLNPILLTRLSYAYNNYEIDKIFDEHSLISENNSIIIIFIELNSFGLNIEGFHFYVKSKSGSPGRDV